MTGARPLVRPLGDRGLVIEVAPRPSPAAVARVLGAEAALAGLPGVVETVPGMCSVLLVYDPARVAYADLAAQVAPAVAAAPPAHLGAGPLVEIPVVYGGAAGPDLDDVARACGLDAREVVRLHSEPDYLAFMLGFAPGYAYLGELTPALRLPRRSSPRPRVPAGSVAIADRFTGIYPLETAGGWHILGRTPVRVFDPARREPFLLRPGARVRFRPVSADTLAQAPPATAAGALGADGVSGPAGAARPALEVVRPGLLTTVQDLGRPGWRRFGVPASGALDPGALGAANAAVGNPPGAAAVELTFPGPVLRALADVEVAVAGADLGASGDGRALPMERAVAVREGAEITFTAPRRGQWAYLAVGGGLETPPVFGSRSANARGGLPGLAGRPLRAGDVLGRGKRRATPSICPVGSDACLEAAPIRVVLGPQADAFEPDAVPALLGAAYQVTVQRDRSGVRLRGPALRHRRGVEIFSEGLLPGTIQVPGDGQPIVILADGPTTGGYPRIASVVSADLARVAQAAPGATLRFVAVEVGRAPDGRVLCSSDA
ncbi:MAG: 5-oxoprolinase subunit PxpB [Armatimonadota bacterium]|nr:5-oxoprolinase subunit PxpB [Armatimonadota bacterium]